VKKIETEQYKLAKSKTEKIPGGRSSGKSREDFPKDQLEKGIKVEMEHSSNQSIAKEIAMDHLDEFPDYYDRLEKVEKK